MNVTATATKPAALTLTKGPKISANGASLAATAMPSVCEFARMDQLPSVYDALFATAGRANVCMTRGWFDILSKHETSDGARLKLLGLSSTDTVGAASALLIGRHRERDWSAFGGRSFTSLDNFYTLLYAPLVATGAETATLAPLVAQLCSALPAYDVIRLQALDPDMPAFSVLRDEFLSHGFAVQTYRHFANWYQPVDGVAYEEYLAARPGALRSTVARKARRLERSGRLEITVSRDLADFAPAWAAYEHVYAASWKVREVQPEFVRDFAEMLAATGAIRLAVLRFSGVPIAAQLWIVWDGVATVYKLAHDKRYDILSPGTVLTARLIEHLLDTEQVRQLDFGPGDDAYKRLWTSHMRERWGILAFNPRSIRGKLGIVRHIWGRAVKRGVEATLISIVRNTSKQI